MGKLLDLARSIRKTVIPVAVTLDAPCEKPTVRRRASLIRELRCPGCSSPIGDATPEWEGVSVCSGCFAVATANPGGFGLTLGRHCRADAAISQRYNDCRV